MENIAVSEFRAHLPGFLKKVKKGEMIILTSRGEEVARVIPPIPSIQQSRAALKKLRAKCKVGDIVSPVASGWKALK